MVGGDISSGRVRRLCCVGLARRSGVDAYSFACPTKPRGRRTMSVAEAEAKREVDVG